ncbi:MAG TPA: hypothetical protein VHW23_46030 [Kofleriaceae bacterium]|nr:hypothetical protein [Kofleriaceae bacterium]
MHARIAKLCAAAAGACLGACGATAGQVKAEPPPSLAVDLSLTGAGTPALAAHCAVKNISSQPVNLLDSPRMPYLIHESGTLVVLDGVSPPEDNVLGAIEIPLTQALPPGASLAFDVPLTPIHLRSHYGEQADPGLHGATPIVCRVAHGATPIDAAARAHTTITGLLAWQQFESSLTLVVKLP